MAARDQAIDKPRNHDVQTPPLAPTRYSRIVYLAGFCAAVCQAVLALLLIGQWQSHQGELALPVGLAIVAILLTVVLAGTSLLAVHSHQGLPVPVAAVVTDTETAVGGPSLEVILQTGQKMWSAQTITDLLEPAAEAMLSLAGAAVASVYLREGGTAGLLERIAVVPASPWVKAPPSLTLAGSALQDDVDAEGHVIIVPLVEQEEVAPRCALRLAGLRGKPSQDTRRILEAMAAQTAAALRTSKLRLRPPVPAFVDELTGLPDRTQALRVLDQEIARAHRFGRSASLIVLDLDDFGDANNVFGQEVGDAVLVAVATSLREELRVWDIAARYGGDEFAVILPETEVQDALAIAERLCRAVNANVSVQGGVQRVDLSGAVVCFPLHGQTPEELLTAATQTLEQAKQQGKNRVLSGQPVGLPIEAVVASSPGMLDEAGMATVEAFAVAVDAKDAYTRGHSQRVSAYSEAIARAMELPEAEIMHLRLAGLLHDVGKIGIPDAILTKLGGLTDGEYAILQQHTIIGDRMVSAVPPLRSICPAVRHHHERWDGTGYPDGLLGEAIPRDAAIVMVADSFDAMTSSRTYRPALRLSEARRRVHDGSGTQFDPRAVEAFERAFDQGLLKPLSPGGTLPLSSTYVARASHGIRSRKKDAP